MSSDAAPEPPAPDTSPRLIAIPPGASYRLPDPGDPVEAHLVEANRADRVHSQQQLARLFPDMSVGDEERTGLLRVDRRRLDRLFNMELLDRLLDHGADPSRIVLSNWQFLGDVTNASLPESERIHAAIAGRAVSDGGRVTLTGVERTTPGLRRLAEHLGRTRQARVFTAAAIGVGAFSGQTDVMLAHDHLIIPVRGQRHVVATMPDGTSLHAGPLGPGEALYAPAGASVSTNAVNELFVHLELRLERPSPRSLMPMIVDLPVAQQIRWSESGLSLHNSLVARWCATLPTRPGTRFSAMLGSQATGKFAGGWVRPTFTGGWCVLGGDGEGRDDGAFRMVVAAGICLRLHESLLSVLATLLSGPPAAVDTATASSTSAERLVELLIATGLMEFSPTEDSDREWDTVDVQRPGTDAG